MSQEKGAGSHGGIDFEAIPGNVHLVDVNKQHTEDSKVVLVPTPSDDPDDPLNWAPRRKFLALTCALVYTMGVGIPTAAIYSVLNDVSRQTDISLSQLNNATGYLFLFLGIGCFVFQPLALQYGKRPVYVLTMLATALICVWPPYTKSKGEWIGSKVVQGFFGAAIESLPEITVSDLFFEHQRSTGLATYGLTLLFASYIAPCIAGFIADGQSWEWVMWWCAIFAAACTVFLFFFQEETNYDRKLKIDKRTGQPIIMGALHNGAVVSNAFSTPVNIDDMLDKENNKIDVDETGSESLAVPDETGVLHSVLSAQNSNVHNQLSRIEIVDGSTVNQNRTSSKTFWSKLSMTSGAKEKFLLHHYFMAPFYLFRLPGILWAGFFYGQSLIWFNVLNATEVLILAAPPYNFSSTACGLAYFSPLIFSFIIYFVVGYFSDWLKVRIARRRGGLSYPEDRLYTIIFYCLLGVAACILWGVGAYYEVHWFGLVFGLGLLGGCSMFGITVSTTYAIDCYKELDTEAMVVVIIIRNVMSFAVSFGITKWIENLGLKNAFISAAFILLACNLTFVPLVIYGPSLRNNSKHYYWSLVQKYRKLGMH
ncbi:unnamed protein product [Kluyveromyces dobzhanskii CBS 2104]|uniref:WGS project CCBQ000000000 data, contig 00102 n=1 Tax=Kluyveromyces dobzhanskii CBS 2104 TaxID=1427455 RepID=A0A0A8L4P0_9SACH|nr:unnamed protein product [Kluyveromyces dobzhanskii CBS 2104]